MTSFFRLCGSPRSGCGPLPHSLRACRVATRPHLLPTCNPDRRVGLRVDPQEFPGGLQHLGFSLSLPPDDGLAGVELRWLVQLAPVAAPRPTMACMTKSRRSARRSSESRSLCSPYSPSMCREADTMQGGKASPVPEAGEGTVHLRQPAVTFVRAVG